MRSLRRFSPRAGVALVLCLVVSAAVPSVGLGHSRLFSSTPAAGSVVGGQFTEYQFVFTEAVADLSATVLAPNGSEVASFVAPRPGVVANFTAEPLPGDGKYTVEYGFMAADGDRQASAFRFTYRTGAAAPALAVARAGETRDGAPPLLAMGAGAIIVVLAAVAIGRAFRRNPSVG